MAIALLSQGRGGGELGPVQGSGVQAADTAPDAALLEQYKGLFLSKALVDRFARNGPNVEYLRFFQSTLTQTQTNAFEFITDAVDGQGGFETGMYIDPHYRELKNPDPQTGLGYYGQGVLGSLGGASRKLIVRRRLADYDNFARVICDTYWSYILQSKDEIRRETTVKELSRFWMNCDLRGSDIIGFLAAPMRQSRMFGHGVVVVDRPDVEIQDQADEENPDNLPYAYAVPSQNIVDWAFNDDGILIAIMIAEPPMGLNYIGGAVPMRIWTPGSWSTWKPTETSDGKVNYTPDRNGPNPLGEVPVAILYNEAYPMPGSFMGKSEMKEVSLIAKTVQNIDSEMREVMRNCAFPFLAVPMKNPNDVRSLVLSTEGAMGYDGESGEPRYVTADLSVLTQLQEMREKKVEQAFAMASLGIISGFVKTTSGFHTQAEFDKSNRRIGLTAAHLEDVETRIAYLYLRWLGKSAEEIRNGNYYSVTYPRNFGLRDKDAVVARSIQLLSMNLGLDANTDILRDLFTTLYPRMGADEIEKLAKSAAQSVQTALTQPAQPGTKGSEIAGKQENIRVQEALARSGFQNLTSALSEGVAAGK